MGRGKGNGWDFQKWSGRRFFFESGTGGHKKKSETSGKAGQEIRHLTIEEAKTQEKALVPERARVLNEGLLPMCS